MFSLKAFVFFAGLLQFCQIPSMVIAPSILGWKEDLLKLKIMNRYIIFVIAGGIVLTVLGTGLVTILCFDDIVSGSRLGTAYAGFMGFFWLYRASIQIFLYARLWPCGIIGRFSYVALTFLFPLQAGVYLTVFVKGIL